MSSTSTASSPTGTGGSNGGGGGGGSSSSPLLFFVALGFGVVFTNLWIIVGVKYCFRYNQRNRALRAQADGDPIDLTAMPRPHRRRREKKLMTMEEVNEQFPLLKYKAWRASREEEGLPAAGGITAPSSRAPSIMEVEITDPTPRAQEVANTELGFVATDLRQADQIAAHVSPTASSDPTQPDHTVAHPPSDSHYNDEKKGGLVTEVEMPAKMVADDDEDEDDEDDDPISNATPPELLAQPGDTCAICLDTLEDDDDVRGLTCGHAFHGACVDPWLTGRRACCPLCKADYYIPKPRPDGEQNQDGQTSGRRTAGVGGLRINLPQNPQSIWLGGRYISSRSRASRHSAGRERGRQQTQYLRSRSQQQDTSTSRNGTGGTDSRSVGRTPRSIVANLFHRSRPDTASRTEPTPAALEAGTVH